MAAALGLGSLGIAAIITPQKSHAVGFSGARASVSSSRGYSSSSSRSTSYSPTRYTAPTTTVTRTTPIKTTSVKKVTPVKTSTPVYRSYRDDDVECTTLKNSRYKSDRETFKRYC